MTNLLHRVYQSAWALLAITALCLVLGSMPAVAAWLQECVEIPNANVDRLQHVSADAIVVLGGGEVVNEDHSPHWNADATRLGVGDALLHARRAPLIVLSGGDGEARQMAARLLSRGVPRTQVRVEDSSRNTRENALDSARILHSIGAQRILLVTSAIHMRRAAASFRKLGFEVLPATVREPPSKDDGDFWQRRERTLMHSGHCVHEIFGLWFYRLCGWA